MTCFVTGICALSVAGAVLWCCKPRNGKPFVSGLIASYIAVAVAMGLIIGLGAVFIGLVGLLSQA